jgi:hypothetical protein
MIMIMNITIMIMTTITTTIMTIITMRRRLAPCTSPTSPLIG